MSLYFRPEKGVLGDVIPFYDNGVFKPFYLRNYRGNRDANHQDSWVMLSTTAAQSMDEIIISASGYLKEATHNGYRIFVSVPVDHCVFCPWPHFLPMERRKSRNNSFSIFSRLFSYLYSASVFAGLRPRILGRTGSFSQH